jgi:hypothetical protein
MAFDRFAMGQAIMQINVNYDQAVNTLPSGFTATVAKVVQFFDNQFTDPISINLHVGYGEVHGTALNAGNLGQSHYTFNTYTYSALRTALVADAKSADDSAAAATLPITDPTGGGTIIVTQAEASALGLLSAGVNVNGYVGFSSTDSFCYDNSAGVPSGQYDFYGVVAHEISEVMGRQVAVGETISGFPRSYYPLDLFHYSAAGVRDFVGSQAGYFSPDGGLSNLGNFNTVSGLDFGDWASNVVHDSFLAISGPGAVNAVSENDLRLMDVLGYDEASLLSAAAIQADYLGITRAGLGADQANAVANEINSGSLTESQYVAQLINGSSNTTGAALTLFDFIKGVTPDSVSLDGLTATAAGLVTQAGGNANASWQQLGASLTDSIFNTAFASNYASLSVPALVDSLYQDIYGSSPSSFAQTYFANLVSYYQSYFVQFDDAHDPDGSIRAKGTLIGDMLKEAMDIGFGKYPAAETGFLTAAAHGTAVYGQNLLLSHSEPVSQLIGTAGPTVDHVLG